MTLLTLATLTFSINASLPPVSYTKAIDWWTGVSLTFSLIALIEFAIVGYITKSDKKCNDIDEEGGGGKTKQESYHDDGKLLTKIKKVDLDHLSRIWYPVAFALFALVYWVWLLF